MTVDPISSTGVAATPADVVRPTAPNTSRGLTREQFEAAMRVMNARSASRPMTSPPGEGETRHARR